MDTYLKSNRFGEVSALKWKGLKMGHARLTRRRIFYGRLFFLYLLQSPHTRYIFGTLSFRRTRFNDKAEHVFQDVYFVKQAMLSVPKVNFAHLTTAALEFILCQKEPFRKIRLV